MFRNYIGLRTVKTGIAVSFCIVAASLLKLDSPFFAAIAAIISMDKTVIQSFNIGKNRMLGTVVGASIGLLCAWFMPGNALICGLGIIVLIIISNLLKIERSISVGGIVLVAIMVNLNGKSPLGYSINRIIDTFIGICIALSVNLVFFPYDNGDLLKNKLNEVSKEIRQYIENIMTQSMSINTGRLHSKMNQLEKEFEVYQINVHAQKNKVLIEELEYKIKSIREAALHISILEKFEKFSSIDEDNRQKAIEAGFREEVTLGGKALLFASNNESIEDENKKEESRDEYLVCNYHFNKLLDAYNSINNT